MEILDTPSADVCTEQPIRGTLEKSTNLRDWLRWFLARDRAAQKLHDMAIASKKPDETTALSYGEAALIGRGNECLLTLTKLGGLLFAWHGTNALEGGTV